MIYETVDNPDQYLRIDGDLKPTPVDPEMDNASYENMQRLKEFGQELFKTHKDDIEKWLEI